jgi:3-hydroxy acid dehydrogenase/malonic semialdehyde reductase
MLQGSVLVTGASAGFGAAIARRFAAAGAKVIVAARRTERLAALVEDIGADQAYAIQMDVRDAQSVSAGIAQLPPRLAEIDCLVNNAGLALGMEPSQSARLSDWDEMIATNCAGLAWVTRAVLPAMVARGRGHIINIGSVAGAYAYPGANVYGASKAFVRQFSQNLRSDLHGTGVRVTCIDPGLCGGTEFSSVRFTGDAVRAEAVYAGMQPLLPEDIAEVVYWAAAAPGHVNVNAIEIMPVAQSMAGFLVHRS